MKRTRPDSSSSSGSSSPSSSDSDSSSSSSSESEDVTHPGPSKKSRMSGNNVLRGANKRIQQHAVSKRLSQAEVEYNKLVASSSVNPDLHTFANLMNVCVRCAEVSSAFNLLQELPTYELKPNVVVYTVLLKGLCDLGWLGDALAGLKYMHATCGTNTRSFNSFFRGCVRWNQLRYAQLGFVYMKEWRVAMDANTYLYMTKICMMNLNADLAWQVASEMQERSEVENTAVFLMVAKCEALRGSFTQAEKAIALHKLVNRDNAKLLGADGDDVAQHVAGRSLLVTSTLTQLLDADKSTIKRPPRLSKQQLKAKANDVFRRMSARESQAEAATVRSFIKLQLRHLQSTDSKNSVRRYKQFGPNKSVPMVEYFHETEPLHCKSGPSGAMSPFQQVFQHFDEELSGQAADAEGKTQVNASHAEKETDHERPVEQLCFDEIFPSAIAAASTTVVPESTRVLPINLELGSGAGEWIANRANASSGSANWIAVEWRNDRVFEIWSKAQFSSLDNVLVLSGDMSHIVQQRIQEGTIADVFINFPEPLQGDDNSKQVLSLELFTRLYALLRPRSSAPHDGGNSSVTVVTDDSALCKAIAGHFAQLQHMFTHRHSDKGYDTNVPNDYGSSFFDRFWDHGHKKKRFYLRYFRIDISSS